MKATNRARGRGGAGFWFALVLTHFAHCGLATRINQELAARGSQRHISSLFCLAFTGFPIVGASRRLDRGTTMLNDAPRLTGHVDDASQLSADRARASPEAS